MALLPPMRPNAYGPNPDEDIDQFTGRPRSEASRAFSASQDGSLAQGGAPAPKPVSPMSGLNGGVKSADREPLGGATGEWDLSKFRALAPNDPFAGTIGDPFAGGAGKPTGPRPAPSNSPSNLRRQSASAPPMAPPINFGAPAAYDDKIGGQSDQIAALPQAGAPAGEYTSPKRGLLQSLGDWAGDAMTGIDQYVRDTPNLLTLGINMMAAANAPSKSEQWQQFAGSFDKFGQANRVDEDRKLSKQDREREIERQKKADAQAAEMHTRQIGSLDREAKDAQRVEQEREATKQVVTGMLKELPADANPVMRNLLEFASIGGNYAPVLEYQIRAAEKAGDREHAEELARLQGNISLQVARMQADREDKRQDNQFNKALAGEEAKSAGASGLEMPQLEDGLKNIDDALALLDKGRGMKTGSVFDPSMTLRYTFGDKQGADLLAALNSNTANRTLAILAAQAGVASESDAQRAGFAAVDPTTMSFDAARERLLKMREYTVEDMARTEAQRVWRRDVGPVFSAFITMPDKRQLSFDQYFKETYKPSAPPPSAVRDLKYSKDEMGSTPNARITAAITGFQKATTPAEWDNVRAALSNMPPDELAKAMAQSPRTRVSTNFATNTIR